MSLSNKLWTFSVFAALAAVTCSPLPAQADTATIAVAWDGSNIAYDFGGGGADYSGLTQTFGETFQTPDATHVDLNDFTFSIYTASGVLQAEAYVYAWDSTNNHITGPALYSSPSPIVLPQTGAYDPVTVNTGSLALTSGHEYVMFLTASQSSDYSADDGASNWELNSSQPYTDGTFVENANNADFAALSTTSWDVGASNLAFTANFSGTPASPVPLPSSFYSGISILCLLAAMPYLPKRRRAVA